MLVSQAEEVCVDASDWSGCVILQPTPNGIALLKNSKLQWLVDTTDSIV